MGYYKQLHIDCYPDNCMAGSVWRESCYMQPDHPDYMPEDDELAALHDNIDEDTPPDGPPVDNELMGDRDPQFDMDRE